MKGTSASHYPQIAPAKATTVALDIFVPVHGDTIKSAGDGLAELRVHPEQGLGSQIELRTPA